MADMFFKKCTDLEGAISNSSPTPRKGKGKADAGVFHWVRVTYSMQKSSVGHQQNAGRAFLLNKVLIVIKTFWCLNNIVRFWTKGKENQVRFIKYTGCNDGVKKMMVQRNSDFHVVIQYFLLFTSISRDKFRGHLLISRW